MAFCFSLKHYRDDDLTRGFLKLAKNSSKLKAFVEKLTIPNMFAATIGQLMK